MKKTMPRSPFRPHAGNTPNTANTRRRTCLRAAATLAAVAAVAVVAARCDVDGGLLDRNSGASRNLVEQRDAAIKAAEDRDYYDRHKDDVDEVAVAFLGEICDSVKALDSTVAGTQGRDTPVSVETAVTTMAGNLRAVADSADAGAARVSAAHTPVVDVILMPSTPPDAWMHINADVSGGFHEAASNVRDLENELQSRSYTDENALALTLESINSRTGEQLDTLGTTIEQSLNASPISNKQTRDALSNTGKCVSARS
ncbi:hypothetical protein PXH69_21095 [Rhodococcus qingshengii]|uniref:Uncharacterized protein n=1 Tax=Rhodococcus qingshengii TaxID=334542 RepID=A0AAW6LQI8_RHOSG|nr:hypothetical protein [Rhodococcus qingshengii]MDE8647472.1 hypothetical protein [Rhodococcus qingshengii]